MTYGEWVSETYANYNGHGGAERLGQYLFNRLNAVRPDITNPMIAGEFDPFHRDDIVPAFLVEVARRW